jgi:hypothetical protein
MIAYTSIAVFLCSAIAPAVANGLLPGVSLSRLTGLIAPVASNDAPCRLHAIAGGPMMSNTDAVPASIALQG